VTLAHEYEAQFNWRHWSTLLAAAPLRPGQLVLDLGSGVGDQARALVERGARVLGIEADPRLLSHAKARPIVGAEFRAHDLRNLPDLGVLADGIWCSFTAAYFPALPAALQRWQRHLKPRGWVVFVEVDDLFGHHPLSDRTKAALDAFAREALELGHYDFCMGRKLRAYVEECGFTVHNEFTVPDQELSFTGSATPDIVSAWRARFDRLLRLQTRLGEDFAEVRDEFLHCLRQPDHRSTAKVYCVVATTGATDPFTHPHTHP